MLGRIERRATGLTDRADHRRPQTGQKNRIFLFRHSCRRVAARGANNPNRTLAPSASNFLALSPALDATVTIVELRQITEASIGVLASIEHVHIHLAPAAKAKPISLADGIQ
jgi:predicted phage-related endonuclease